VSSDCCFRQLLSAAVHYFSHRCVLILCSVSASIDGFRGVKRDSLSMDEAPEGTDVRY